MSFGKSFNESYQQSPTWSGRGKKNSLDEDDDLNLLDSKILDADTPQYLISTDLDHISTENYPSEEPSQGNMWFENSHQHGHMPMQHTHPLSGSHPSTTDGADADHHHQMLFTNSQESWASISGSGACTPTPAFTSFKRETEDSSLSHRQSSLNQRHVQKTPAFGLPSSIPMSPQSSQGWMSTTSSELADHQAALLASPHLQPVSPIAVQRRDGVRKKNARFEIPKDRNLNTIDQLIKIYTERGDEPKVKELKQQKRLLRNRQAALDSRQRKKQHTEELEKEKSKTDQEIKDLREELESYKLSVNEFIQAQASLQEQQRQLHEYINNLQIERDELIRSTTIESENLRRQNNIIREHAQQLERDLDALQSNQMDEFGNFEGMPLDGGANWNEYNMPTSFQPDHSIHVQQAQHDSFASQPPPPPPLKQDAAFNKSKSDYPFSLNTFYMCVLFGAFIASNTGSSSSGSKTTQPSVTIPHLSDEYRAESANVLKAVLASAPSNAIDAIPSAASSSTTLLPHRSRSSNRYQGQPTTISAAEMARISSNPASASTLTDLHNSLTSMTRAQEEIQAFSLTPEQYASITGLDSQESSHVPHPHPQHQQQHQAPSRAQPNKPNPTPLQQAFASIRASQDHLDRTLLRNGAWDRSAVVDATSAMAMNNNANVNIGSNSRNSNVDQNNNAHAGSEELPVGPVSWDDAVSMPIPEKVVRDFTRMVEESQHGQIQGQKRRVISVDGSLEVMDDSRSSSTTSVNMVGMDGILDAEGETV